MTKFPFLLAAACTLSLGSIGIAPASAAEVQIQASGPVVELNVTESVQAKPDIAMVNAGVTVMAQTAVEAMRQNAQQMSAVIDKIKALGIASEDIQTTSINLNAQYDYDQTQRRQVFRGYQASNQVSVKLHKIQDTGKVLDALVAAGATDINGPSFSIEDETAAQAQARKAAMTHAQEQAMEYARLAGYSGVRLLEVSESMNAPPPMPMFIRAESAKAQSASTPVEPGMVTTGVTILVKYEMTR